MVIQLIVAALAAWRITQAIQYEKVGKPIRKYFAGERQDVAGLFAYSDSLVAELVMCFKCLSFWVSVFCVGMSFVFPIFLYPFAVSAGVIFVEKVY